MTHLERCECVRHCRWVDEVVADAPWVITQEFIDEHQIDYVAHDEDPYAGSDGSKDIYQFVKDQGKFLPTRRTPGVSTSELLHRIVAGYRIGDWDNKLVKSGHPDLQSTSMPGSPFIRSAAHSPPPSLSVSSSSKLGMTPAGKASSAGLDSSVKTPPA
ncbi:hypothetical protein FRC10_000954 [Ceratobasidium sp. 414]|nr:hypothetical protein FRC10_000954 [Ceratobasidium sp. 414]